MADVPVTLEFMDAYAEKLAGMEERIKGYRERLAKLATEKKIELPVQILKAPDIASAVRAMDAFAGHLLVAIEGAESQAIFGPSQHSKRRTRDGRSPPAQTVQPTKKRRRTE